MVQKAVFGLHTAEFKRWVSLKESNSIKSFFGLNPDEELASTYFYKQGVTKIWIEKISGKSKPRYYFHIIVNFARTLRTSNYRAMPYMTVNIRKVFTAINKILKVLPLSDGNRKFQDWTVARFDSVFDVYEEHTELLMQLLNLSLDLGNVRKKCRRIPIQGKTAEESMGQSMRFGNNSFTYNVYRKMEEIQDKGRAITEAEKAEIQHLLRVERQNHQDAVKKLLPNMKASDLATSKVRDAILKTMIDEIELFFGKGDYCSWKKIQNNYFTKESFAKKYIPENYIPKSRADKDAIIEVLKRATLNSLEAAQEVYTKEISDIFAKLGLSPVGIKKDDAERYGVDWIQGIYGRIIAEFPRPPDKRQYNAFPVPHQTKNDGRIGANVTFYSISNGKKTVSIRGNTLEDYESKVFRKLSETYLINRQYLKSDDIGKRDMLMKSADAVKRFHRAAKTVATKQNAESFIESVIEIDEKKFSDCPSVSGGS